MASLTSEHQARPGHFYGWWIVATGFSLQLLNNGLARRAFSLYFVNLRTEFGWSSASLSASFAMAQAFGSGMLGPLQGWLLDRYGPRGVIRLGLVFLALGLVVLSQAHSFLIFFGAVFVAGVGTGLIGYLTITTTVAKWFEKRRTLALALAGSGQSVGGLLLPLVAVAMVGFGWRTTAISTAVIVVIVGFPLAQLMRRTPEGFGYGPDGRPLMPAVQRSDTPSAGGREPLRRSGEASGETPASFTPRMAFRTPAFWLLNLGHGSAILVMMALNLHLIPHLVLRFDMPLEAAAGIAAITPLISIPAGISGGFVADRMSKRVLAALCLLAHGVGLLLLAFAPSLSWVFAAIMIHGIAVGVRAPLMIAIRADYFGRASFATIMGFAMAIVSIATFIGPVLAGFLADRLGDYQVAFVVLAVVSALGGLFFLAARKPSLAAAQSAPVPA